MLFLEPIRLGFQTGPATKALNLAPMTRTTITTRETVPKKTKEAGGSTSMGFAHSSKDLQRWKSIYQSSIIIKNNKRIFVFSHSSGVTQSISMADTIPVGTTTL